MNPLRMWQVLRKDLALGPRSPFFLWAVVIPVVATVLLQVVFGGLFTPKPRLGIVDGGASEIAAAYRAMNGITVTMLANEQDLRRLVEAHRFDAGLVLPADFDNSVRAGAKPPLQFFLSGESLASNRIVLAVTAIDLVRAVEGSSPPVDVQVETLGAAEWLPLSARMVPLLVMFSLMIAGVFLPATALVEEKERRTLSALLVTPVKLPEVLTAKAALGMLLALVMGLMTLVLNNALGGDVGALLIAMLVAALMSAELGLLYGVVSKDMKALFALFKGLNIFLLAPVIFYLFPEWPQWIPKVLPTYWIINPIFDVAVKGARLNSVWIQLMIALAICVALAAAILSLTRRMERALAAG